MQLLTRYFASANGYFGFHSYFSEIFNPTSFTRIYVLKGGPGTGKSSFMKKLSKDLLAHGYAVEQIMCSSDPDSLDGIIAQGSENRIAVIDGTAPHERDAMIVGACDELINLGSALDTRWLTAQRDHIENLCKEKSEAYKSAYAYLSVSGESERQRTKMIEKLIDAKRLKYAINKAAESTLAAKPGKKRIQLKSAVCRRGTMWLPDMVTPEKTYSVIGDKHVAQRFLSGISKALEEDGIEFIHSPSPLDPALTEEIYVPDRKIKYTLKPCDNTIDIREFYTPDSVVNERCKCALEISRIALDEAYRWFSIASEIHFALEDIYGGAMNFGTVDRIYEEKSEEILKILE